ncbi:MAG: exostosin family protein [Edaphobacter sp.]|uniref:exostosin domain-containing protein n=1 Tax=Edaphobacter sp. TaxID=1934404 RepID=UPI00238CE3F5|nr:exostosin family protein [Edaphobacter sp.]MDE1178137.1 exostosin family protein [Edaphobacter sp.]
MKIHLVCLLQRTYDAVLQLHRQASPSLHQLVDDPHQADMILFVGRWSFYGGEVVDHPLPRLYPEKTFVYSDDDIFAPLLPGVYASARRGRFFDLGRMASQKFIDWQNPHIQAIDCPKQYLFSFAGRSSSLLRKLLFRINYRRSDVFIEDTSYYDHWTIQPDREANQRRYVETIAASHFALCPRGASSGSYRLFEVMQMGIAPIILSDRYILPEGPDWESFALVVPERKIASLPQILERHVAESEQRGRLAAQAYRQWFADEAVFNHIIALCQQLRERRKVPERWVQRLWPLMLWRLRAIRTAREAVRSTALLAMRLAGRGGVPAAAPPRND